MSEITPDNKVMIKRTQILIGTVSKNSDKKHIEIMYDTWHKFYNMHIRVNYILGKILSEPGYNVLGATIFNDDFECDLTVRFDNIDYNCRGYGYCYSDSNDTEAVRYVLDRIEVPKFIETELHEYLKRTNEWNHKILHDMYAEAYPPISLSNDVDLSVYGYVNERDGERMVAYNHILLAHETREKMESSLTGSVMQRFSVMSSAPASLRRNDYKDLARYVINILGWMNVGRYTEEQTKMYIDAWYELAKIQDIDFNEYYNALRFLSEKDSITVPLWIYDNNRIKIPTS